MKINYWKCEYSDYDEIWTGEDEIIIYGCSHSLGCGSCNLENKYSGKEDDCKILDNDT